MGNDTALDVRVHDVWQGYGDGDVLRDVTCAFPAGTVTALLGPSGVGKTTLLRTITGFHAPFGGRVELDETSLYDLRPARFDELRRRFGVLMQGDGVFGSALWGHLSLRANCELQLRSLFPHLDDDLVQDLAAARLDEVGLTAAADQRPAEISGGMRRRAALARALVSNPDLLVLDGPELGADGVRVALLADVLAARHAATGPTVVLVTHDRWLAAEVASRAVLLHDGRVALEGPVGAVLDAVDDYDRALGLALPVSDYRPPAEPQDSVGVELFTGWQAGLVVLTVMTATVAFGFGRPGALELLLVVAAWATTVGIFVARRRATR